MSKGNNKKGNREAKKPKKIIPKAPVTEGFSSNLSKVKTSSKKQK